MSSDEVRALGEAQPDWAMSAGGDVTRGASAAEGDFSLGLGVLRWDPPVMAWSLKG